MRLIEEIEGRYPYKVHVDPIERDSSSQPVKAAVEGGRKLEIRVDDAGDGNAADWGIIANGILTR